MLYDNVDASDVAQTETLRQSELVARLAHRVESEPCRELKAVIAEWLLDNSIVLVQK